MMAEECDAGDILLAESTQIGEDEDAVSLHDRLRDMGAALLQKTIRNIETIKPIQQDHAKATFAPLLRKEDGIIDMTRPAIEIDRLIRAMTPWPGAVLDGIKIHRARVTELGELELLEVQAPGKKRMKAEDYFRGVR
jgi:methionyl-tRNA formyltransferase